MLSESIGYLNHSISISTKISDEGFTEFFETCNKHLNCHAPCKQKYARGNHFTIYE